MKRGKKVLSLALCLALVCALALPAHAAEPYNMLEHIAYYGDRSKCAMTAEQAQAFLETIQEAMESELEGKYWGTTGEASYAALFDTGEGSPALFFVRALVSENYLRSYGAMKKIWTYQNGKVVPFTPSYLDDIIKDTYSRDRDPDLALYPSCVIAYTDEYGALNEYGIHPLDGSLSNTPTHRVFVIPDGEDGPLYYWIDGDEATETQVGDFWEQWCGSNDLYLRNGLADAGTAQVTLSISGLTPINDVKIALYAYITATQSSTRVQLHLNGGSGGSALWTNDSGTIQVPTNPTREGYTFGGWYTDEGLTTPWNFNNTVTGALTLYAKWAPVSSTATSATQSENVITLNGREATVQAYNLIADTNGGDVTYVKLRDVAALLDGTSAQFNVDWRNKAIYVETGKSYTTRNGTELKPVTGVQGTYRWNTAPVLFDGETKPLEGLCLATAKGDHTYFKLRDLADALGFRVDWSAEKGITIETE